MYQFGDNVSGENWDYDVYCTCPVCGGKTGGVAKRPQLDAKCMKCGQEWHIDLDTQTIQPGDGDV